MSNLSIYGFYFCIIASPFYNDTTRYLKNNCLIVHRYIEYIEFKMITSCYLKCIEVICSYKVYALIIMYIVYTLYYIHRKPLRIAFPPLWQWYIHRLIPINGCCPARGSWQSQSRDSLEPINHGVSSEALTLLLLIIMP